VGRHLRELFAEDPARGERLWAEAAGLYLDYSKNRITDETLRLLLQLAGQSGLEQHRDAILPTRQRGTWPASALTSSAHPAPGSFRRRHRR
jgi:glucose-6-phosphate isomerase